MVDCRRQPGTTTDAGIPAVSDLEVLTAGADEGARRVS
ncbi:MAG: hypothetical protein QOE13_1386 [Gaiellaceae bacterium]|jgi:hypothetical protein|nr:hypothetical protein [Gaiellaceae bacterium]